jgi:hypothetical protein
LPEQPTFYVETNQEYAEQIVRKWNTGQGRKVFETRFNIRKACMDKYATHQVGSAIRPEWWIPKEDLGSLNDNILGKIEIIG